MLREKNNPKVEIIYNKLMESAAYKLEHKIIKDIGTRFDNKHPGPLLNMNLGGQGGRSPCKTIKEKISSSRTGKCCGKNNSIHKIDISKEKNPFYGKSHNKKSKSKMRRKYLLIDSNFKMYLVDNLFNFCKRYNIGMLRFTSAIKHKKLYHGFLGIKLSKNINIKQSYKRLKKEYPKAKHIFFESKINKNFSKWYLEKDNIKTFFYGNAQLSLFCNNNNISLFTLKRYLNKVVPVIKRESDKSRYKNSELPLG